MYGIRKISNPAEVMRQERAKECFPVINRGKLWYESLTLEQLRELKNWYREWLDAPKTLKRPVMPSWINDTIAEEEILL